MHPKLILINGNPGLGKSTIAERYVTEHPLSMNLDTDRIWHMFGQWQQNRPKSDELKYEYACVLADLHLSKGYDVVVPSYFAETEPIGAFERAAETIGARLVETVLTTDIDDAIERCKARARRMGYQDGFRPGGVLDLGGREQKLKAMYSDVQAVTAQRPHTVSIESLDGDIEGTYRRFLDAI